MQFRKRALVSPGISMSTSNGSSSSSNKRRICMAVAAAIFLAAAIAITMTTNEPSSSATSGGIHTKKNASTARTIRFEEVPVDEKSGVLRYSAVDDASGSELSFKDWILLLSDPDSSDLAKTMTKILKEAPFRGFRFETPAVSMETISERRFEFVLVEDEYLANFAATPNPRPFSKFLTSPSCEEGSGESTAATPAAGCVFANLGGDATLVAPRDWSPESNPSLYSSSYGHLANFVRGAPEEQVLKLWRTAGTALKQKLLTSAERNGSSEPLWFSTAGTGVAWLHFRLDSSPKYYEYGPFTIFSN